MSVGGLNNYDMTFNWAKFGFNVARAWMSIDWVNLPHIFDKNMAF